jgi:hypothetical protein
MPQELRKSVGRKVGTAFTKSSEMARFRHFPLDDGDPYGNPNDDWLDLDRDAFATSGFKLNRGQIVGRARITQRGNPYLIDQTNREGLKENPEKQAFVKVLSAVVEIYRQYLNEIDRDVDRARRVRVPAGSRPDEGRASAWRLRVLAPVVAADGARVRA